MQNIWMPMSLLCRYIYTGKCFLLLSLDYLQNRDYYKLGVYTVMSIVQGGCGLPYLSKPFFNYLFYGTYTGISDLVTLSHIPDIQLRCIVEKVQCEPIPSRCACELCVACKTGSSLAKFRSSWVGVLAGLMVHVCVGWSDHR